MTVIKQKDILSKLIETKDKVQDTVDDCKNFIETAKDSDDPKKQKAVSEALEKLESLELALEKLDEKITGKEFLH